MGEQKVEGQRDGDQLRAFMQSLLRDLQALEQMLAMKAFETDRIRIGAPGANVVVCKTELKKNGRTSPSFVRVSQTS